jgi:ribosomal protein S18
MARKKKKLRMRRNRIPASILLRRKQKSCPFKEAGITRIDYKDVEMLKAQQEEAAARSTASITKTAPAESGETNSDEAETSSAKEETPENAIAVSAEASPKEDQDPDQSEAAETENTEA